MKTGDLASKALWCRADEDALKIWSNWTERSEYYEGGVFEDIALVREGEIVIGYVEYGDLISPLDGRRIRDFTKAISSQLVADANTPAIDLVRKFATSDEPFIFVRSNDLIDHLLPYPDLFSPSFRLCIFALLVAIEGACLAALLSCPTECADLLEKTERDRAIRLYRKNARKTKKEGDPRPGDLLQCTYFSDKLKLLRRWKRTTGLKSVISSDFDLAVEIRNEIAHASDDEDSRPVLLERSRLGSFFTWSDLVQTELWSTAQAITEQRDRSASRSWGSVQDIGSD